MRYSTREERSDDEIAKRALDMLPWAVRVPHERIQVENRITLSEVVDRYHQEKAAKNAVRKFSGVLGVDQTAIEARVQPSHM